MCLQNALKGLSIAAILLQIGIPPCQGQSKSEKTAHKATSQTEIVFWQSVSNSSDTADFQAYLARYPDGEFAELARLRLARLKKAHEAESQPAQAVSASAPSTVQPPPPLPSALTTADFNGDWVGMTGSCVRGGHSWSFLRVHFDPTAKENMSAAGSYTQTGLAAAKTSGQTLKIVSETELTYSNWATDVVWRLLDRDNFVISNSGFREECRYARLGTQAASTPDDSSIAGYDGLSGHGAFMGGLLGLLTGTLGNGGATQAIRGYQALDRQNHAIAVGPPATAAPSQGTVGSVSAKMSDFPGPPKYGYTPSAACKVIQSCDY